MNGFDVCFAVWWWISPIVKDIPSDLIIKFNHILHGFRYPCDTQIQIS